MSLVIDHEKDKNRIFEGYSSILDTYKVDFTSKKEEIEYLKDLKKAIKMNPILLPEERVCLINKANEFLNTYYNSNINRELIYELHKVLSKKKITINEMGILVDLIDLRELEDFDYNFLKIIDDIIEMINNDSDIRVKLDSLDGYNEIKKKALMKLQYLFKSTNEENLIRFDIENHRLVLTNMFEGSIAKSIKFNFKEEDIVSGKRIITINKINYPAINLAFSVEDIIDMYILDVYVSDVPTLLASNRRLAEIAYERGCAFYLRGDNNSVYNIEMLPIYASHAYMSLNKNKTKNVITFNTIISKSGEVLGQSVYRNRIRVNEALMSKEAEDIINKRGSKGVVDIDINNLNEIAKLLHYSGELLFFPAQIVNDYVKRNNDLVIYRDKEIYSKNGRNAHASTPLKDFASNINLGLLLYQNGLLDINDNDIHLIKDNIDEIIDHLNYKERVKKYIYNNSSEMFKYIKREIK